MPCESLGENKKTLQNEVDWAEIQIIYWCVCKTSVCSNWLQIRFKIRLYCFKLARTSNLCTIRSIKLWTINNMWIFFPKNTKRREQFTNTYSHWTIYQFIDNLSAELSTICLLRMSLLLVIHYYIIQTTICCEVTEFTHIIRDNVEKTPTCIVRCWLLLLYIGTCCICWGRTSATR